MTQAVSPTNHFSQTSTNSRGTKRQVLDVEVIRALTPIFIAAIGGLVGTGLLIVVLFKPDVDATKFTAGMGLATTAITGAAGLAQPGRANGTDKKTASEETEQSR